LEDGLRCQGNLSIEDKRGKKRKEKGGIKVGRGRDRYFLGTCYIYFPLSSLSEEVFYPLMETEREKKKGKEKKK